MPIGNPGVPGANLPAGEDHVMRRLADLERAYRELVASTAVRPGSLGNDTLTSPVVPEAISGQTVDFALPMAGVALAAQTFTIPSGVTSACFVVTSALNVRNTRAVSDQMAGTIEIDFGGALAMAYLASTLSTVLAGQWLTTPATAIDTYVQSGLTPGGTLTVQLYANAVGANWAGTSGNQATLRGFILWFH